MSVTVVPIHSQYEEYLRDESRRTGDAETISFPRSHEEVVEVLARMRERHCPVTIQGARTGLTAGSVPDGGHIMNLSRMNRFTGMRRDEEGAVFLTVQPGVLLSQIRETLAALSFDTSDWSEESRCALQALEQAGPHFFPPDPTETSASIGGMVNCNASGAQSFHYGPTRSHVEGLRVVLPEGNTLTIRRGRQRAEGRRFRLRCDDGQVLEGRLPSYDTPKVKSAAGYEVFDDMDLLDLFVGMEGTLGVITEIELRLSPSPQAKWGLMCFLPEEGPALRLVRALRGEELKGLPRIEQEPVAIEFFNSPALDLLRRQKAANAAFAAIPHMPERFQTCVYAEYHGADEERVVATLRRVAEALNRLGGSDDDTWASSTPREMERLKFFRHAIPESVNLLIDERRKDEPALTKLGTDMSVPDSELERVLEMYNRGLDAKGLQGVMWGHIGNNHLHVNILPRSLADYETGKALYLEWAARVVEMGGSVSAEHGIGKLKTPFLKLMYGREAIAEMHALKRLFDPDDLLNRGNLFKDIDADPEAAMGVSED